MTPCLLFTNRVRKKDRTLTYILKMSYCQSSGNGQALNILEPLLVTGDKKSRYNIFRNKILGMILEIMYVLTQSFLKFHNVRQSV